MPDPFAIAGAAANALSSYANTQAGFMANQQNFVNQQKLNAQQYKWASDRYNLERANALADRAYENDYNSPAAIMARLKNAGLNPNLVYGNGNSVQAAARTANASTPGVSPTVARFQPVPFDAGSAIGSFVDIAVKNQQLSNMKLQNLLIAKQILKTGADTAFIETKTDTEDRYRQPNIESQTALNHGKKDLMPYNQQVLENQALKIVAETSNINARTQFTLDENQRQELANSANVKLTLEKLITQKLTNEKIPYDIQLIKKRIDQAEIDYQQKSKGYNLAALNRIYSDIIQDIQGKPRFGD